MSRLKRFLGNRDNIGFIYILPWLLGFLILQLYPFVSSLYYSFTNYSMGSATKWLGFANYIKLFTKDREFWKCLRVTLQYMFLSVPLKLIFALLIALLLNKKIAGMNGYRTLCYIPSIMGSSVAVAVIWRMFFQKDGVINNIFGVLGVPSVNWLGSEPLALLTIALLSVWQFGSSMVIFLAALKQIPSTLYEAAEMDGAGRISCFFRITLPMITPMTFFNIVMQMINAFQEFTSAFIITNGGPTKGTYLFGMKLYTEAFSYFKIGYASALSWIMFTVVMLITAILFQTSNRWVFYSDGGASI